MGESANGFQFREYLQFTFQADDQTLSCFLDELAIRNINITGYAQIRQACSANFLKVVVGTPTEQSEEDVEAAEKILETLGVKYKLYNIIQVFGFPPVTPGVINTLYGALRCRVIVRATYIGEDNVLYMDVNNVQKALRILTQPILRRCPKD